MSELSSRELTTPGRASYTPRFDAALRSADLENVKTSHLFGGILGGISFGLVAGLLLGSCVFSGGPNHQSVAIERPGAPQPGSGGPGGGAAMGGGGGGVGESGVGQGGIAPGAPGGMDPGSGMMEAVFARVAELKASVEKNPADQGPLIELANLYYDAGKFAQAVAFYDKALSIDGSDPNLLTDAGNCYWQTGNTAKALELFKEAQRRSPAHWQSAANMFFLAASLGDRALAGQALERVKTVNPGFDKIHTMEDIYAKLKPPGGA